MHLSARCQEDSGTLVDISRLAKFPRISHGINIAFHPRARARRRRIREIRLHAAGPIFLKAPPPVSSVLAGRHLHPISDAEQAGYIGRGRNGITTKRYPG